MLGSNVTTEATQRASGSNAFRDGQDVNNLLEHVLTDNGRSHSKGDHNRRYPSVLDDKALQVLKKLVKTRYQLIPYIIEQAKSAASQGVPLVHALVPDYSEDTNVRQLEIQYLFGSDLLVAPTQQSLQDASSQSVYLPAGVWYDLREKTKYFSQGKWFDFPAAPIEEMYIFVRSGTMLCWGKQTKGMKNTGTIEVVEMYGETRDDNHGWSCGDGEGGLVEVVPYFMGGEKWVVKGRGEVAVRHFR